MTDLQTNLLNHLKDNCRGRDRAWPVRMLAGYFKADDREIREALRELNLQGQPIVTLTSKPYGAYYFRRILHEIPKNSFSNLVRREIY
jgi:hypothetical protein